MSLLLRLLSAQHQPWALGSCSLSRCVCVCVWVCVCVCVCVIRHIYLSHTCMHVHSCVTQPTTPFSRAHTHTHETHTHTHTHAHTHTYTVHNPDHYGNKHIPEVHINSDRHSSERPLDPKVPLDVLCAVLIRLHSSLSVFDVLCCRLYVSVMCVWCMCDVCVCGVCVCVCVCGIFVGMARGDHVF